MIETIKYTLDTNESLCEICYTSHTGNDNFLVLSGCGHFFCKLCVNAYANDIISKGDITKLICPDFSGCKIVLNEVNLREVGLPEEVIEKEIRFSINQAIDRMEDFGWCPMA